MAVEKSVNVVISAQDKFSGAMSSLGGAWLTIGKAAAAAEVAILAASIAAAKFSYDIGKDVVQSAVDFHDAIYDITAVAASFGTTSQDVSDILDDLVNRFPVTGKEAGVALETIAQKGFGAKDSLAALGDTALNLSIATGKDLDTSVKLLTNTMNVFGLGVGDTDRLMNLFAATQFSSAASVDGLAEAMKNGGIAMALNGQSAETAAAAFGLLANKGLEMSQVGTVLRMGMAQLYKETDKGRAVLAQFGLTYDDVNPKTQDFSDIIEKLGRPGVGGHLFDVRDATDLFGVRQQALGLLIQDGAQKFRDYRDSITGTTAGVDALEEKLKKFDVVVNNLGGSMDIFKKTIGIDLVTAIAEFIGYDEKSGLRGVVTFLYEMEKAHGGIGDEFTNTFQNVKEILGSAFKDAFPDLQTFYDWLVKLAGAAGANIKILAAFLGQTTEGLIGSSKSTEVLVSALELVRISLVALTVPLALLHDAFYGVYYVAKEGFEGIGGAAAYLDLQVKEFTLSMLESLKKVPFIGKSDWLRDNIAQIGRDIIALQDAQKKGFSLEPTNFWYDNVLKASAQSKAAIADFAAGAEKSFSGIGSLTQEGAKRWEDMTGQIYNANYEVGELYDSHVKLFEALKKGSGDLADATKDLPAGAESLLKALKDAGLEASVTAKGVIEVKGATDDAQIAASKVLTKWQDSQTAVKGTGDNAQIVFDETQKVGTAAGEVKGAWVEFGATVSKSKDDMSDLGIATKTTANGTLEMSAGVEKTGKQVIVLENGIWKIKTAIDGVNEKGIDLKTADAKTKLEIFKTTVGEISDVIQTKIEWEAKLKIATLEEDTKRAIAYADNIKESFVAAASATATAFEGLATVGGAHFYDYLARVDKQLKIQEDLAAAQIANLAKQTEYLQLKNDALRRGDAASQVNVAVEGDMEGWLAGLLESLFKNIFTKATAEGFNVLAEG